MEPYQAVALKGGVDSREGYMYWSQKIIRLKNCLRLKKKLKPAMCPISENLEEVGDHCTRRFSEQHNFAYCLIFSLSCNIPQKKKYPSSVLLPDINGL